MGGVLRDARERGVATCSAADRREALHAEALAFVGALIAIVLTFLLSMSAGDPRGARLGVLAVIITYGTVTAIAALSRHGTALVLGLAACLAAVQTTAVGIWAPSDLPLMPIALALIESKTVVLVAGTVALVPIALRSLELQRDRDLRWAVTAMAVIPVWALVTLAWGGWHGQATLAYGRNFATPAMLVLLLACAVSLRVNASLLSGALAAVAFVLTIGSAAQLLIGHEEFSKIVHIDKLMAVKGPISSYTDFLGVIVPRLRSLVGEPINASYTFAALTWWAVVRRHWALVPILAIQNVLTFAKGGMLMSLTVVIWLLFARVSRNRAWPTRAALMSALLVPLYVVYISLSSATSPLLLILDPLSVSHGQNSAFTHAAGLILGLQRAVTNPMGEGLGSGGNFGDIFTANVSHEDWIQSGAESAIAVLAVQLGVVAIAALIVGFTNLLRVAERMSANGSELGPKVGAGLLVGWLFSSLFQENAWGPQAAIPIFAVVTFCFLQSEVKQLQ